MATLLKVKKPNRKEDRDKSNKQSQFKMDKSKIIDR